ncbi:hypothetical protein ACYJ1Y_11430 [Natrialbaceae archaeon A-gly3]
MTTHIKLYGSKSDRFEDIKTAMEEQLGYEPSNPEVVGLMMAAYESDGARFHQRRPQRARSR